MRFSLRTLFWMFPVTLVAYGLAYLEASIQYIDTYLEALSAFTQVESNARFFAEHFQDDPTPIDIDLLNQWLNKTLPLLQPERDRFEALASRQYVYQRPLQAVALDAAGNPLPDEKLAQRIGFYVRHGDLAPRADASKLHVLNTCTINSWSTTRDAARAIDRQKIQPRIQARALSNWPWALVLLILFVLALLPFVDSLLKKLYPRAARDPSIPPADQVWPLS